MINSKDEAVREGMRKKTMNKSMAALVICIAGYTMSAVAQTNTFPATGNVGIGTTSPAAVLTVNDQLGNWTYPATSGTTQSNIAMRIQNGAVSLDFGVDGNGTNWIQTTNVYNFSATYPLLLNPNGGNIGIGTTNAQSTLDVNGNIDYMTMTVGLGVDSGPNGSGYYYVGSLPNSGQGVVQHLEVEVVGGGWTYQGLTRWVCNAYGGSVKCTRLNDSYSPDMNDLVAYLDGNGNYDLYVSSNTNTAWSSFAVSAKLYDGSNYRTVNVISTPSPAGSPVPVTLVQGPTFVTSNGSVGIGTQAPAYKLDIAGGQVNSSGGFCISGNCISGWPANVVAGSNVITQSNGNVGIGTTIPVGQLSNSSINYGDLGSGQYTNTFNWNNTSAAGWNSISSTSNLGLVVATDQTNGVTFQVSSGIYNPSTGQRANHLLSVLGTGSVGIGTTNPQAKLEINGNLRFTADGSVQTTAWTGTLCGGDYAEAVNAKGSPKSYEPGDVLVLGDGDAGEVEKSSEPYSTMVAGIFATKPGVIGRRQTLLKDTEEIPMAMIGIVPTKVTTENGPIHRGDLLVSSSTNGYAMKGTDRSRMLGAVIGKSMGILEKGTGVVEVLVTLQ